MGAALDWEPQNTSSVEHVINGLCEGNTISTPANNPFKFAAQHMVVRNNLLIGLDMGIDVFGDPQMPAGWTTDIAIYNNTQYYPNDGRLKRVLRPPEANRDTTGNVTLANNILWTNSSSSYSALYVSWDSLGTVTNNGHGT